MNLFAKINKNKPSALWKMARVPSASATNTRPLTCLPGRERGNENMNLTVFNNTYVFQKHYSLGRHLH